MLWLLLFAVMVLFFSRGYPLVLAPQSGTPPLVTPVVKRPLPGPGVPIEMLMTSLPSAVGEGVPTLLLGFVKEESRLTWEFEGQWEYLDLAWSVEPDEQLLTVRGDEVVAVAPFGATELAVVSAGDGGALLERWPVPQGVVTGLYAHSRGLLCVSTEPIDPTRYPGEFTEGSDADEGEESPLFSDHLWLRDRGSWAQQSIVLEDTAVLTFHQGAAGFPSRDAILGLHASDFAAGGGPHPFRLSFLSEGDPHQAWPLSLNVSPTSPLSLALGATHEALPLVIVWDKNHVLAYGDGGGEPRWTFQPPSVASGGDEVTSAFIFSGGTVVVTTGATVHFLDRDGHATAALSMRSPIVAALPLAAFDGIFAMLTEEQIALYDHSAREIWREPVDCSPLAWDIFTVEEGDHAAIYMGVVTRCHLIQYRIDSAP